MSDKARKIIEIANLSGNSSEVELWTEKFKVRGTLLKDLSQISEGIVSIINARIKPLHSDDEHTEIIVQNWLNIFEDKIIAFTVIKK